MLHISRNSLRVKVIPTLGVDSGMTGAAIDALVSEIMFQLSEKYTSM